MDPRAEWLDIIEKTKALLAAQWPGGVTLKNDQLLLVRTPALRPAVPQFQASRSVAAASLALTAGPSADEAAKKLVVLSGRIKECQRCGLAKTRTQTVFGNGHPCAKVMFIGEAPGRDEDEQGEVFVGEAGQLLTKILAAINFKRADVYITNVLKCRPPGNRDPLPEEATLCKEYLLAQIDLVKPMVICALGRYAAQTLLNTSEGILELRKKTHQFNGVPVVATLHPSALLRNPGWKKLAWDDVRRLRTIYDQKAGKHV
jgi:DNA polymerase